MLSYASLQLGIPQTLSREFNYPNYPKELIITTQAGPEVALTLNKKVIKFSLLLFIFSQFEVKMTDHKKSLRSTNYFSWYSLFSLTVVKPLLPYASNFLFLLPQFSEIFETL